MTDQVLYFWAEWCAPCRATARVFDALKEEHPNIEFRKVDVDQEHSFATLHGVRAVPTMVHLREGKEVGRLTGARSKKETATELNL